MIQPASKIFFLFVFIFFALVASAQQVSIKGKATTYEGSEIGLFVYDDLLTSREVLIGSGEINEHGDFEIKAALNRTTLAFLKIENTAAHIYLETNSTYNIVFTSLDKTKSYPTVNVTFVPLQFEGQEPTELNALIIGFNILYDDFLQDNYNLILKKTPLPVTAFIHKTDSLYAAVDNTYFKDFRKYSIASLEQMSYKNKLQLYNNYIAGKPVLYDNPEYINFFKQYYLNYLLQFSQTQKNEKKYWKISIQKKTIRL